MEQYRQKLLTEDKEEQPNLLLNKIETEIDLDVDL